MTSNLSDDPLIIMMDKKQKGYVISVGDNDGSAEAKDVNDQIECVGGEEEVVLVRCIRNL